MSDNIKGGLYIKKKEASSKSSLKYLNIKNLEIGKSSNVWNLHLEPRLETRKAIVKARMMTGSYILEIDKHKFNNQPSNEVQSITSFVIANLVLHLSFHVCDVNFFKIVSLMIVKTNENPVHELLIQ
jgi:hypothetical protein